MTLERRQTKDRNIFAGHNLLWSAYRLHFIGFLIGLLFGPEDGGNTLLQIVGELLPDYMALPFQKKK
jgi:hypothetical protein